MSVTIMRVPLHRQDLDQVPGIELIVDPVTQYFNPWVSEKNKVDRFG
jgi:hypothetical protein